MTAETYILYLAAVLIFFAHPPGPSQMLFIAGSLRHGVRGALPIMAGDLSANALQILAAGLGLAGLLAASGEAFLIVKWAGIAYLVWTGIGLWRSADSAAGPGAAPPTGLLFRRGFLTSAANPYAILFFAALFPQFLDPGLPLAPQIVILGLTYIAVDGAILLAFGGAARWLSLRFGRRLERRLTRLSAAALVGTAVALGLRDGPPALSR